MASSIITNNKKFFTPFNILFSNINRPRTDSPINIHNLKYYTRSAIKKPSLMDGEVTCIMCTWNEEQMVPFAIESSKDFVKRYIVIDKDGSTVPTIEECKKKWNLDIDILIKPRMTLRESRAYAVRDVEEPWVLIQDGDEVFHTDGPNSIFNLKRFMIRPNIVLCAPMATLSCDFYHTNSKEPIQDPHKFLYHNNGTLRAPDKKSDHLMMDGWKIFLDRIYKFNCRIKSPRRMFLRQFWDEWCKNTDAYLKFSNLEEYVANKLAIDIERESDDWYKRFKETLIPYSKKKWGYYPKIIRKYLLQKKRSDHHEHPQSPTIQ